MRTPEGFVRRSCPDCDGKGRRNVGYTKFETCLRCRGAGEFLVPEFQVEDGSEERPVE